MVFERRVLALAFLVGAPGLVLGLVLLWAGDFSAPTEWNLTLLSVGLSLAIAATLRGHVIGPLQTISNMLAALREGAFSMRAHGANSKDALGLLLLELTGLGEDLRGQRLGALEATALLRRVMEEIDVAVFAFDGAAALRVVNRSGAALLGRPAEQLLGQSATEPRLAEALGGETPRVWDWQGRWGVRPGTFP